AVGLALQRGQVVEQRRHLRGGLALFADVAVLAHALPADLVGLGLFPDARRLGVLIVALLEFLVEPAALVGAGDGAEFGLDFPVVARDEGADLFLALDQNRQRRRLHAADRRLVEAAFLGVEGGHGARAVDADQPVGFRARTRGV